METIRIATFEYFVYLMGRLFFLIIAVLLPLYYIHYSTTGDVIDFNVLTVALITFFCGLFDMIFLKSAKKPVCISFAETSCVIESRFLFWLSIRDFSYEDISFYFNRERKYLRIWKKTELFCFTPPLWGRQKRELIAERMIQKHVKERKEDSM